MKTMNMNKIPETNTDDWFDEIEKGIPLETNIFIYLFIFFFNNTLKIYDISNFNSVLLALWQHLRRL